MKVETNMVIDEMLVVNLARLGIEETKYHFVLTFSKSQESKRVRVRVKV